MQEPDKSLQGLAWNSLANLCTNPCLDHVPLVDSLSSNCPSVNYLLYLREFHRFLT